jgi:tetratricopeptide (TPR) repeat protein
MSQPLPLTNGGTTTIDSFVRELARAPDVAPFGGEGGADVLPVVDASHYILEGECGRGGLGRVLRASDGRLGRPVAIKELISPTADASARFVREATITGRLQHPGIIPIYEAGRWPGGKPFYAMKLVEGRTLADLLHDARTPQRRLELLPNVLAVAEAMAYAHSRKVIHRDLKPSNVLVGAFGETVVIDWGLAKDLSQPPTDNAIEPAAGSPRGQPGDTCEGARLGTPAYMAPEQAAGSALDARADVYALGAILYELLAGAPPHVGTDLSSLFRRIAAGEWVPLRARVPTAPLDLVSIVDKAMAPEAGDRYPSAIELADDLRRFQAGRLVAAHRYTPGQLLARALHRHRTLALVAGSLVALLMALSVYGVQRILRERDLARRQRAAAESLVDFALVDLRDQLTKVGRLDPLLGLGKEVGLYYSRLEKALPDLDDDGRRRRSQAFEVLGDVQDARGEHALAVDAYRAGLVLREELMRRPQAPREARLDTARLYIRVAQSLTDVRDDDALAAVEHAQLLLEPVTNERLDATYAELVGEALAQTGDLLLKRDELDLSEAAYERAIDVQELSRDSTDPRVRIILSRCQERLGVVQQKRGNFERALHHFRASLDVCQKLAAEENTPRYRSLLEQAYSKLGSTFEAAGRLAEAQKEYRRALDIDLQLVALDPTNVGWLHGLVAGYSNLGTLLLRLKDLDGAEKAFAEQYRAIDRVARTDEKNMRWQRNLAVALSKLGQVKFDRGNLSGAQADYQRMVEILAKVLNAAPDDAKTRQYLSIAHSYVSELCLARGDRQGGLAAAQAMVDLVKDRAGADNVAFSKVLAVGYGQVASAHTHPGGDRGAAEASLRQAISILEGLRSQGRLDAEGAEHLAEVQQQLNALVAPPESRSVKAQR